MQDPCIQDGESKECAPMMTFSTDPAVAEQQMHAIIYYLTAFGYIDGDFDNAERGFIRDYIAKLVHGRAVSTIGEDLSGHVDIIQRWTEHFHEVMDGIDREIQDYFTESVAESEDTKQFVLAKLKLRTFELFKRFDEENRAALLATAEELIAADGVVHPEEQKFRDDIQALLEAPIELDDLDVEPIERGDVVIDQAKQVAPRLPDHPFFKMFEHDYASDAATFAQQSAADLALVERFMATLEEQRKLGKGKLGAASDFSHFAPGTIFLDGHVYVYKPAADEKVELLVLGDLHGCYTCLKAALLQADFFAKVEAYREDPHNNPKMIAVFLGDYIDRGKYSYNGILRTVMQLFVTVPGHVFVLRGNHEYYIEHKGRVLAPVRPAEAMQSLESIAPTEMFQAYMRLFESLPNMLVFDQMLFVHAGIPRDETIDSKYKDLTSLNDGDMRFQMLWSDPSDTDFVPDTLQKANARFPFGRHQFRAFMQRIGCTTMIRGHERVIEGFKTIYDEADAKLLSLFSAGGKNNNDLPLKSNYREVTPMALTIHFEDGVTQITPFVIEYERYNDPQFNSFFKNRLAPTITI